MPARGQCCWALFVHPCAAKQVPDRSTIAAYVFAYVALGCGCTAQRCIVLWMMQTCGQLSGSRAGESWHEPPNSATQTMQP